MSLDTGRLQEAASPVSSGRSSPSNPRLRLGAEDALNKQDKSYRRYASAVERALSLFDTALQEWADYISFLARLLKALQIRPSGVAKIPNKALVAKRLAQCLNPSLPSGVHQKTIEVYTYIFNVLGKDGLARDLPLYLPGLSPTLSYASLSTKPALLSLFENHILAINPSFIRPALKAILLALLPGLEEESSEEFERTHSILIDLKAAIGMNDDSDGTRSDISSDQYYWQCLFLASITSASRRQGALAFMVRNLPYLGRYFEGCESFGRRQPINETLRDVPVEVSWAVEAVSSPEPGLLVRSFAAGLCDEQILIQRGFLDLLVSHLPLRSEVLQRKATREDVDRLVAAAASVVARREMSLNRRLWTWFLGPNPTPTSQSETPISPKYPSSDGVDNSIPSPQGGHRTYFELYGLDALVRSILKMVHHASVAPSDRARPFRICLSLMDRWEIGGVVIPRLLLPLLESAWQYQSTSPSRESFEEVLRSSSVFFDGVESGLIWGQIAKMLRSSLSNDNNIVDAQDRLDLILFIITKYNIREEDMQTVHMPLVTVEILVHLRNKMLGSRGSLDSRPAKLEQMALKIALTLLDLIPERAFDNGTVAPQSMPLGEEMSESIATGQNFLDSVHDFYERYQGSVDPAEVPCSSKRLGQLLLDNIVHIILLSLRTKSHVKQLEMELSIMEKATRKLPGTELLDKDHYLLALVQASKNIITQSEQFVSIEPIVAVTLALETFSTSLPSQFWQKSHHMRQVIPDLVRRLWPSLSPSKPGHNVEAVRCIWRLQLISSDIRLIEGCIATLLTEDCHTLHFGNENLEGARRFATLWAHSSSTVNKLYSRHPSHTRIRYLDLANEALSAYPELVLLERPLMLLLDSLCEIKTEMCDFTTHWLQSLPSLHVIVQSLIHRLRTSNFLIHCLSLTAPKGTSSAPYNLGDLDDCLYVLQTVTNLVIHSPVNIWASFSNHAPLTEPMRIVGAENTATFSETISPSKEPTIQEFLIRICLIILGDRLWESENPVAKASSLRRAATSLLKQMLLGNLPAAPTHASIEDRAIAALAQSVRHADTLLQAPLMDLLVVTMGTRSIYSKGNAQSSHQRPMSDDSNKLLHRLSISAEKIEKPGVPPAAFPPPPALLECLLLGLSSPSSYPVLEHWVGFLDQCLPFYAEDAFHVLLPLVECFNEAIKTVFHLLRAGFEGEDTAAVPHEPLATLNSLLNGLERSLARAHERLIQHEAGVISLKTPEQNQGFFGNMVSGVFAPETGKSRRTTANNRLTVLLCFKDAIRVCLDIWTWNGQGSNNLSSEFVPSASLNYTSIRMKNRTRRILEHLFAAEALECLETLVELWSQSRHQSDSTKSSAVFNLLHVLDGSRPKNTIPALFNAMYSRTNPGALDPIRKSSLTADLSDIALADFLVSYMRSLEDDAMDEIWSDCMTFLKDVLGNPLPHRQILPRLLAFTAILGEKVSNTNFGEQRRMRRDLGDLFVRLLAAAFTAKPLSFASEDVRAADNNSVASDHASNYKEPQPDDVVGIVASLLPNLLKILIDTDRIAAASSIIILQVLAPTIQSKSYPRNVLESTLSILLTMSRIPEASRPWHKIVAEAFNDPRFFSVSSLVLVEDGWIPVLRQWAMLDTERMQDYTSRMMPPTAAGIMFGVGASSARLEADRKTQLILRRMSLLVLAAADDTYVANLVGIQEKILELLTATAASSPSSATRAEVYMLLRALILKTSAAHMASFWPIMNSELYDALSSLFTGQRNDTYNIYCILQACKLLDTLVTLAPDDFQLREWLFITDTVDAVYRPPAWSPVALVDELVEDLNSNAGTRNTTLTPTVAAVSQSGQRKPLLSSGVVGDVRKEDIIDQILHPFFRQLSISAFESTYSMETPDWKACYDVLICDIFDDSTIS